MVAWISEDGAGTTWKRKKKKFPLVFDGPEDNDPRVPVQQPIPVWQPKAPTLNWGTVRPAAKNLIDSGLIQDSPESYSQWLSLPDAEKRKRLSGSPTIQAASAKAVDAVTPILQGLSIPWEQGVAPVIGTGQYTLAKATGNKTITDRYDALRAQYPNWNNQGIFREVAKQTLAQDMPTIRPKKELYTPEWFPGGQARINPQINTGAFIPLLTDPLNVVGVGSAPVGAYARELAAGAKVSAQAAKQAAKKAAPVVGDAVRGIAEQGGRSVKQPFSTELGFAAGKAKKPVVPWKPSVVRDEVSVVRVDDGSRVSRFGWVKVYKSEGLWKAQQFDDNGKAVTYIAQTDTKPKAVAAAKEWAQKQVDREFADIPATGGQTVPPSVPKAVSGVANDVPVDVPKSVETPKVLTNQSADDLKVGDKFATSGGSGVAPQSGTVKKVNPKTIVYDTEYMGKPLTLTVKKSDLTGEIRKMAPSEPTPTVKAVETPKPVVTLPRPEPVTSPAPAAPGGVPPVEPPKTAVASPDPFDIEGKVSGLRGKQVAYESALAKVKQLFPENKALIPEQRQLYRKVHKQQTAAIQSIRGKNVSTEALNESLGVMKGEMPKVQFPESLPKLTTEELSALIDKARTAPEWQALDFAGYSQALRVMQETNTIMSRADLRAWEKLLGLSKGKLSDTTAFRNFVDALGIPKTLTTMLDLSAPLRQGSLFINRKEWRNSLAPMVKSFAKEDVAQAVDGVIRSSPNFEMSQLLDEPLYIAERTSPHLAKREEAFMTSLLQRTPVLGSIARASERSYVTFLNKLRYDLFDNAVNGWKAQGLSAYQVNKNAQDWVKVINRFTGRGNIGDIGKSDTMMGLLNASFFAPRFVASRAQVPGLIAMLKTNPAVGKQVGRDLGLWLAGGATIAGIAAMAGAKVELDPRSTDFGKIRIGNSRMDIWAGEQQLARYSTQFITGRRKSSSGQIDAINRSDIAKRFVQGKMSPIGSLIVSMVEGKNFVGEPMTPDIGTVGREVWTRVTPMFLAGVIEGYREDGMAGASLNSMSLFGTGAQTYQPAFNEWMTKYPETSRLNIGFGFVGNTIDGKAITKDERDQYQKLTSIYSEKYVKNLLMSAEYNGLDDAQRKLAIERAISAGRKQAQSEVKGGQMSQQVAPKQSTSDFRNRIMKQPVGVR